MAKKAFKLDTKAFSTEVINAEFMVQMTRDVAESVKDRCGEGYEASAEKGRKRALGAVWAETFEAKKDDSDNNTLLKAISTYKQGY